MHNQQIYKKEQTIVHLLFHQLKKKHNKPYIAAHILDKI